MSHIEFKSPIWDIFSKINIIYKYIIFYCKPTYYKNCLKINLKKFRY